MGAPWVTAKAQTYLGSAESDRAADDLRRETYATTMIGRIHVLRGDIDAAGDGLRAAIALGERDRWLAFLPWPQAFLGEVELIRGDVDAAESILGQAVARACLGPRPLSRGSSHRCSR